MAEQDDDRWLRLAAEIGTLSEGARAVTAAAWNNTLGLFGLEHPHPEVREWQAEHPVLDVVSGIPAMVGFYGGGTKAVGALPRYGKWVKSLGRAEKAIENPFLAKATQEFFTLAPIESARQAIGYSIQENSEYEGAPLKERIMEAGINTAFGAGVAGLFGKLASGGKVVRLPEALKDISAQDSWQVNLRKAREAFLKTEDALERNEIEKVIWNLEGKIKTESRKVFVQPLEGSANETLGNVNGLFRGTDNITSQMLAIDRDSGFTRIADLDKVLKNLTEEKILPSSWLEYSQFPRIVSPKNEKAEKYISRILEENLSSVGNGWSMAKEKDGLYVLARKTNDGKWFLTKTDTPGKFMPEQGHLQQILERDAWRDPDTIYKGTGDKENVLDRTLTFHDGLEGGIRAGDVKGSKMFEASKKGVKELANRTGMGNIADYEIVSNTIDEANRLFSPTAFQFKNSPRARAIYATAQNTLDNAKRKAQEWIYGKVSLNGKSLMGSIAKGINKNNLEAWATKAMELAHKNDKAAKAVIDTIIDQVPFEQVLKDEARRSALGADGLAILKEINDIDKGVLKEYFSTMGALHIPENRIFMPRQGYYSLSHYWKGSLRQAILDEEGRLFTFLGGDNKKGLLKTAQGIIDEAKREGRDLRLGTFWTKNREIDLAQEKLLSPDNFSLAQEFEARYLDKNPGIKKASFMMPRDNVAGWNAPKNMKELIEGIQYSIENKYIHMAKTINEHILSRDLATLGIDQPKVAAQLEEKLNILKGEQGIFSRLVNKTADKILAPVLGTDSASKIVHALNGASAMLDLGFGNFAYALANLLQPFTTVLPHLSMLKSCPEVLQWAYDGIPLISKSGKGGIAYNISPMKIMTKAFKVMSKPGSEEGFEEFAERLLRDGVLSPRFIENYIGENSGLGQSIIQATKQGDYSGAVKQLGSMLPSFSEQASRGYAATVGYLYFNSFYKAGLMSKEQVYLAAKKFTENTMFQFAASDRALVLQGPVGQAWGLFKNWTMHFIGWQMEYLNAGLKHGCWAPYMYSNLTTSMLGGLGSSEIGAVLERFAEWAGDDKMSNLLYDRWGDSAGSQMLLYGLPGAFGYSLQGQVNSPFTDPGEEAQRFMSFVYGSRLKALWNAAARGIDVWTTSGVNPASDPNFQRQLARAFGPKMFYRSGQMVGDTLYSLSNGNKVVGDLSPMEQMMYKYFNLPSVRIQEGMRISNEIWKDKNKRSQLTSKYSEAMAAAIESEDGRLMYRIIERALVDGVDVPSVVDGAQKKVKNTYLSPLERNRDYYADYGLTADVLNL